MVVAEIWPILCQDVVVSVVFAPAICGKSTKINYVKCNTINVKMFGIIFGMSAGTMKNRSINLPVAWERN